MDSAVTVIADKCSGFSDPSAVTVHADTAGISTILTYFGRVTGVEKITRIRTIVTPAAAG
jgi:hypothetical protein